MQYKQFFSADKEDHYFFRYCSWWVLRLMKHLNRTKNQHQQVRRLFGMNC